MRTAATFLKKYFTALFCAFYLFSIGIFNSLHRRFISAICEHFGIKFRNFIPIIPETEQKELFPEEPAVKILEVVSAEGNISVEELIIINKIAANYNPDVVLEIGTFDGRTTLNIAANTGADSKIYTIDLPEKNIADTKYKVSGGEKLFIQKDKSGTRFLNTPYAKKIIQLEGDSAVYDFSALFNKVDLVFIDGSHVYEYVKSDTDTALKLLKNGKGIILWHDYDTWDGVTKYLNELYKSKTEFKNLRRIKNTSIVFLNNKF